MTTKLRVGLIGAGGIAAPHVEALLALSAEVRILRRTAATALAEMYDVEIVDDLDALIDASDVVDIISPTATHPELALRAIARGRHVICEKPLAATAEDAAVIVRAAADAGVRLFPAHVVRYFPDYRGIKQWVGDGMIGDVTELVLSRVGAGPDAAWFFDENAGGGLIRDLMIHDIDQAIWLAGPVASVSAVQDPPSSAGVLPRVVTADVVLTHRSGAVSRIHGGWLGPGTPFRTTIEVIGSTGRLRHDSAEAPPDGYLPPADAGESPYLTQLRDFLTALEDGTDARILPADAVDAVTVVDAAYRSLATRAPVPL
ncbi:gfo/Idh/MocA family oxidoreductase [Microbacterium bovistercoris]|uniref:Gfo/Idh/MocA family oxidoreductase n=1 Tax=Microbacterium bovistercoris TaxID=2293570 RepID=A0A371NSF1_9MICO|nr:Gfo/Idh/MocA family oxidoreductase [Microbacterium bovistercoris]REJ05099.1 gfo/Idh/MocA family oxidoreductase [Microbacterium bovistercoris]